MYGYIIGIMQQGANVNSETLPDGYLQEEDSEQWITQEDTDDVITSED